MRLISAHDGLLRERNGDSAASTKAAGFSTGLPALDQLLPSSGLALGAVHEVLSRDDCVPWFFTLVLAGAAMKQSKNRVLIWSDRRIEFYPPGLPLTGLRANRLLLLQVDDPADELWALGQCLRCKGVGATVAAPSRLSLVEVRRLQLAAERGGGIAVLLRNERALHSHYAAATRWLVRPARGDETVQRWNVQLIHGHGGQVGKSILLEVCRDPFNSNPVRAVDPLADRPDQAEAVKVSA